MEYADFGSKKDSHLLCPTPWSTVFLRSSPHCPKKHPLLRVREPLEAPKRVRNGAMPEPSSDYPTKPLRAFRRIAAAGPFKSFPDPPQRAGVDMVEQRNKTPPGFLFTANRIRSAAFDTAARFCARPVLLPFGFSLGPALGSVYSTGQKHPLVVCFLNAIAESNFLPPFVIGFVSLPFLCFPRDRGKRQVL